MSQYIKLTLLRDNCAGDLPGWARGLLASCMTDPDKSAPRPEWRGQEQGCAWDAPPCGSPSVHSHMWPSPQQHGIFHWFPPSKETAAKWKDYSVGRFSQKEKWREIRFSFWSRNRGCYPWMYLGWQLSSEYTLGDGKDTSLAFQQSAFQDTAYR